LGRLEVPAVRRVSAAETNVGSSGRRFFLFVVVEVGLGRVEVEATGTEVEDDATGGGVGRGGVV